MLDAIVALILISGLANAARVRYLKRRRAPAARSATSPSVDLMECPHGMPGGLTRRLCAECIVAIDHLQRDRERMRDAPCKHGVPGGLMRARCAICKSELAHQSGPVSRTATQRSPGQRSPRRAARRTINLYGLSPREFETFVCSLYRRMGFDVQQTPFVNDFGRDAVASKDGKTYLIECKRYRPTRSVGRRDLQIFHSAIVDAGAERGFFVTTGKFKKTAREFVRMKDIDLIDGPALIALLRQFPIQL